MDITMVQGKILIILIGNNMDRDLYCKVKFTKPEGDHIVCYPPNRFFIKQNDFHTLILYSRDDDDFEFGIIKSGIFEIKTNEDSPKDTRLKKIRINGF